MWYKYWWMNYGARAGLVHTARALYALNWMDMAPALEYIKTAMNLTVNLNNYT